MNTARVICNGERQIIELPKNFRLAGEQMSVVQSGRAIILEPIVEDWRWLDEISNRMDDDFATAATEEIEGQKRPELDEFFK